MPFSSKDAEEDAKSMFERYRIASPNCDNGRMLFELLEAMADSRTDGDSASDAALAVDMIVSDFMERSWTKR